MLTSFLPTIPPTSGEHRWGVIGARMVRIHLQCRRPWFDSWVRKIHWRRDRLPTPVFLGFPCGSAGKESTHNAGDLGSIPGLGRYSWNHGLDSPWDREESDTTEWLSLSLSFIKSIQQIVCWVLEGTYHCTRFQKNAIKKHEVTYITPFNLLSTLWNRYCYPHSLFFLICKTEIIPLKATVTITVGHSSCHTTTPASTRQNFSVCSHLPLYFSDTISN